MYIQEIGKNKYRVYINDRTDFNGKRQRVTKTFTATSKKDLKRQIEEWLDGETATGTVSEMIETVWQNITANKSPTTIEGYRVVRERIDRTFGNCRLTDLSPRTIQTWINSLEDYSPKTVKNTYSLLRRVCTVAVAWEFLKTNPCHDVILPVNHKEEAKVLTSDQFRIFFEHLDELDLDTKVMIELALFGSLRRGEIMGIKENDIPENGRFFVCEARYNLNGTEHHKSVKTPSGERFCYLPNVVVRDVKALQREHLEKRLKYGAMWKNSEYLIKAEDGSALHPSRANDRLRRYMTSIGLEPITFHQLRHTYASMCIAFGYDIETISKRMGHANPSITLSIYSHLFDTDDGHVDGIASKFDEYVANK